jgi:hypothetical protein
MECGNSLVKEVVSAAAPAVEKAAESRAKAKAQRMEDEDHPNIPAMVIKCPNLLITAYYQAKVADFGTMREMIFAVLTGITIAGMLGCLIPSTWTWWRWRAVALALAVYCLSRSLALLPRRAGNDHHLACVTQEEMRLLVESKRERDRDYP